MPPRYNTFLENYLGKYLSKTAMAATFQVSKPSTPLRADPLWGNAECG
jgi:hypothetical protein